jgi:hypothetical protein
MARPLRIEYPGAYYHVMNRGQSKRGGENEARMVAIYLGRQLGGTSMSVSSAYLLMKERVAKEKQLQQRVRRIEEALTKSKKRTWPLTIASG